MLESNGTPAEGGGTAAGPMRFSINRGRDAQYVSGFRSFMQYRDLGIADATSGRFDAKIVKAVPGHAERAPWHRHALDFQMVFVLKGWITLDYEGVGPVTLEPGDCVHQAPGIRHVEIGHSNDYEGLEITAPAQFQTVETEPLSAERPQKGSD